MKKIKKALKEQQISPKTFHIESKKLEKWVSKEREEIHRRKRDMERGWKCTYDTVLKTRRDIMFTAKNSSSTVHVNVLGNSFSQEHIKIIDNFHSESYSLPYQLSVSQSSEQFNANLVESQKLNSSGGGIIDIVQQNHALQEKYHKYEEELSKSEIFDDEHDDKKEIAKTFMTIEELRQEQEKLNVPHTSPSPSPKEDDQDDESFVGSSLQSDELHKLSQCQGLKMTSLPSKSEDQNQFNEKQANSYAIIITNMLIENEIHQLSEDLKARDIDLLEVSNRYLYGIQIQELTDNTITNSKQQSHQSQNQNQSVKQSKGIKTNLTQVKSYMQRLVDYIKSNYSHELVKQVNVPLGPTSKEMLKYLHFNDFTSINS